MQCCSKQTLLLQGKTAKLQLQATHAHHTQPAAPTIKCVIARQRGGCRKQPSPTPSTAALHSRLC